MKKIKELSQTFFGIAIAIAILFVIILIFKGGIALADMVLPWIQWVSGFVFLINVIVFLPMSFFKKTRTASAVAFYLSSYVYGMELWIRSLLITYVLWGGFWVVVGLLFGGVGVLPMSLLATLFNGEWMVFFALLLGAAMTYGSRILANYLDHKSTEDQLNRSDVPQVEIKAAE